MVEARFISEGNNFLLIYKPKISAEKAHLKIHRIISDDSIMHTTLCCNGNSYKCETWPSFDGQIKELTINDDCFWIHIEGMKYLYVGTFMTYIRSKGKVKRFNFSKFGGTRTPYVIDVKQNCYLLNLEVHMDLIYHKMAIFNCYDPIEIFWKHIYPNCLNRI